MLLSVWFYDQLSRAHKTIEHQAFEITNYVSQVEKLDQIISDLQNTIVDSKPIPNSKSSEEDIKQLQPKILELQDADTALRGGAEHLIKLKRVPEPSSEAYDDSIIKQEGLLNEKRSENEYFQEVCGKSEGKMQGSVQVS